MIEKITSPGGGITVIGIILAAAAVGIVMSYIIGYSKGYEEGKKRAMQRKEVNK